jgi:hypothetical protein
MVKNYNMNTKGWIAGGIILAVLLLITIIGGIIFIPAGNVGVITQFGATRVKSFSRVCLSRCPYSRA